MRFPQGLERVQEPLSLSQPFFDLCTAVPMMVFLHSHSKSLFEIQAASWCGLCV